MLIPPFFLRHRRFSQELDAFVDGELRGAALARFQAHLAACDSCMDSVGRARMLKASLSGVLESQTRRSFLLTPEMVRETAARAVEAPRIPVYLVVARGAAAVAVVTFAAVFAVSLAGGSGDDQTEATAGEAPNERNAQPVAADSAAGGAAPSTAESQLSIASPTALTAPSSGGVAGASAASPTPEVPTTGLYATPPGPSLNDDFSTKSSAGPPESALGDAVGVAEVASDSTGDSGGLPWTIVLGCVAGAAVGIMATLEFSRRRS